MKGSLHNRIRRRGTEHEPNSAGMVRKQPECPVFPMNALHSNFFILSNVMMLKLPARSSSLPDCKPCDHDHGHDHSFGGLSIRKALTCRESLEQRTSGCRKGSARQIMSCGKCVKFGRGAAERRMSVSAQWRSVNHVMAKFS